MDGRNLRHLVSVADYYLCVLTFVSRGVWSPGVHHLELGKLWVSDIEEDPGSTYLGFYLRKRDNCFRVHLSIFFYGTVSSYSSSGLVEFCIPVGV